MSSARNHADREHRLVLLRGGLDDHGTLDDASSGDGGADWQDFCRRIGWQPPETEPRDDFEDRLAERLFAKATPDNNVVRLDVERAARALGCASLLSMGPQAAPYPGALGDAAEADFAPISDVYLRRASGRFDASELDASERLDVAGRFNAAPSPNPDQPRAAPKCR